MVNQGITVVTNSIGYRFFHDCHLISMPIFLVSLTTVVTVTR